MDTEVKKQLDAFCSSVGMNTNVVFNIFARVVVKEKRLPFEIKIADDTSNEQLAQIKSKVEDKKLVVLRAQAALKEAQQNAQENGTSEMTMEEIDQEIALARADAHREAHIYE
jgi:addiction module RelB/DinJ family antitoxin